MTYQTSNPGIAVVTSAAYGKSTLVDPGADITSTAGSFTEIDSSLRVTLAVPASGKVLVRQAAVVQNNSGTADCFLGVQVDGTGSFTTTGANNIPTANVSQPIFGEAEITGLTLGSHTFYFGWHGNGIQQNEIRCHSFGAAAAGTWQSVTTLP